MEKALSKIGDDSGYFTAHQYLQTCKVVRINGTKIPPNAVALYDQLVTEDVLARKQMATSTTDRPLKMPRVCQLIGDDVHVDENYNTAREYATDADDNLNFEQFDVEDDNSNYSVASNIDNINEYNVLLRIKCINLNLNLNLNFNFNLNLHLHLHLKHGRSAEFRVRV